MTEMKVVRNDEQSRYEIHVDGELAGFAEFRLTTGTITFPHTEVDSAYEGQGVGSTLVKETLDDVISRGDRRIKIVCPFIKAWVKRHPEYQDKLTLADSD